QSPYAGRSPVALWYIKTTELPSGRPTARTTTPPPILVPTSHAARSGASTPSRLGTSEQSQGRANPLQQRVRPAPRPRDHRGIARLGRSHRAGRDRARAGTRVRRRRSARRGEVP